MSITYIDPPELHTSPVYAQGTLCEGGKTLYVGGQNGTDANGVISGDIAEQSAQAMRNVLQVLAAAGATQEHVAKLTIYLVEGTDLQAGFAAGIAVWGQHRTAITGLRVAGLARPEALIEIDAIAIIP